MVLVSQIFLVPWTVFIIKFVRIFSVSKFHLHVGFNVLSSIWTLLLYLLSKQDHIDNSIVYVDSFSSQNICILLLFDVYVANFL